MGLRFYFHGNKRQFRAFLRLLSLLPSDTRVLDVRRLEVR